MFFRLVQSGHPEKLSPGYCFSPLSWKWCGTVTGLCEKKEKRRGDSPRAVRSPGLPDPALSASCDRLQDLQQHRVGRSTALATETGDSPTGSVGRAASREIEAARLAGEDRAGDGSGRDERGGHIRPRPVFGEEGVESHRLRRTGRLETDRLVAFAVILRGNDRGKGAASIGTEDEEALVRAARVVDPVAKWVCQGGADDKVGSRSGQGTSTK